MSEEDRIAQALALVKADRRAEAQEIVAEVIRANKNNARAWILMAKIVEDPQKALQCWERVARLKPDDPRVQQEIAKLKGEPIPQAQPSMRLPVASPAQPSAPGEQKSEAPVHEPPDQAVSLSARNKRGSLPGRHKVGLPWLIGGGVVLIVIAMVAVLVIASITPPSDASHQPQTTSTTATFATITERDNPTYSPAAATITEQNVPAAVSVSATSTISDLDLPTAVPTAATIAPTATSQPVATSTPAPGNISQPADTSSPPTATQPSIVFSPGTYLVGADIEPGIYRGEAGSNTTCYWARLEAPSEVLVDNDSVGQFYIEIRSTDYAIETQCELVPLVSLPPGTGVYPQIIKAGMYLVGRDIQAGTYRGQAGDDSSTACYWERLSDVTGELDSIIANDFVEGQFDIQVTAGDFALSTTCDLTRVGN